MTGGQDFYVPPRSGFSVRLDLVEGGRSVAHTSIRDPRRVVVIGVSRGGEGALLIGSTYPKLVHGVVGLVASNVVNPSTDGRSPAWTLHGTPLAHVGRAEFGKPDPTDRPGAFIRAERISGPILTFSGGDDLLWPSSSYMTVLEQRLDKRHFARSHRDVDYGTAGHLLGFAIPYLPAASASRYARRLSRVEG